MSSEKAQGNFSTSEPPSEEALAQALQLKVQDHTGASVDFGSLISSEEGHKTIVIFIRHFWCGLCQDFISYLTANVKPDLMKEHNTDLVIVGCGEYKLIDNYKQLLESPWSIYADPSKALYIKLGMTLRTLEGGASAPEYGKRSFFANITNSIKNIFKLGGPTANAGDIKQLGGEFVFDSQKHPVFVHRMENTRGHATLAQILGAAGVPYESK